MNDSSKPVALGVKNHGYNYKEVYVGSTTWKWTYLDFTTGPNSSSAEIYIWHHATSGKAFADDFWLAKK